MENALVVDRFTLEDQARMARATNYFDWQARLIVREVGQRVVEAGCGIGNLTARLLDREAVIACDREPACIAQLRARFNGRANVYPVVCDISTSAFRDVVRFGADSCVSTNVLEHIEDDRRALDAMRSVVGSGGVVVLLVPAMPALYGSMDEQLGHFRRYSRRGLTAVAESVGLKVEKIFAMNSVGWVGWWWSSCVRRREAVTEGQIEIFDRFVAPVLEKVESVVRPPFGQSLFAVLRKP